MIPGALHLVAESWRMSPRRLLLQVTLLLATAVLSGASLLLLIPIVNSVADSSVTLTVPLAGEVSLAGVPLLALLAAFIMVIAIQALVTHYSAVTTTRIQQLLIDQLRQEAFAAVLAARWTFLLARRRTDVITVITVGAVRAGMAYQQLLQFAVACVIAAVTGIIALVLSPIVAGLAILAVALMGLLQSLSIRPAYRLGVELGERQRTMQAVVTDSLDSIRLVRAHSASATWTQRLALAFASTREVQLANARRQSAVAGLVAVGAAIAGAAIVLVSVSLDVPAATIGLILVLVFRLTLSVRQMVAAAALLANSLPALGDLTELTSSAALEVEAQPGVVSARGELSSDRQLPLLEFHDVSYTYPGSETGVRDLSLTVPRGEITVLVGPSGVGKSTTVDLVLGLLWPEDGAIAVDGRTLEQADLEWWRNHLAYVPQETVLIPGTLRDNLAWSVLGEPMDEDCWAALDQAEAYFARSLPDGLDTLLGDRGQRLSGGERQRIALARALLRRPALLVLDEATSALDDETERGVLDQLHRLTPAVTVLLVAHRRSTIDVADHVVSIG